MIENLLTGGTKTQSMTIARMKVGAPSIQSQAIGLTRAESRLTELVDIGSAMQDRAQKTRKLDGFLRFFQSFLRSVNGNSSVSSAMPQITPVEIEFIKLDNPYIKKLDKQV